MNTENKQYRMFDMGCAYLTYCGVKSDEDEFENMMECCEELNRLANENEQLKKENEKLESLWEDKCIKEYMKFLGENALQEMHNEKYGDK